MRDGRDVVKAEDLLYFADFVLKAESYHRPTTTLPIISNPAAHEHLLIMSIKTPLILMHTDRQTHTLTHICTNPNVTTLVG